MSEEKEYPHGEFNIEYYQICLITDWPRICSKLKKIDKLDELRERAKKLIPFFDEILIEDRRVRITYKQRLYICFDFFPYDSDRCTMVHYADTINEAREIFYKLDKELFNVPL